VGAAVLDTVAMHETVCMDSSLVSEQIDNQNQQGY